MNRRAGRQNPKRRSQHPQTQIFKAVNGIQVKKQNRLIEIMRDAKSEFMTVECHTRYGKTAVFQAPKCSPQIYIPPNVFTFVGTKFPEILKFLAIISSRCSTHNFERIASGGVFVT